MTYELLVPIFIMSSALIAIGLYAVMSKKNILKIILAADIVETGVNILIVAMGYLPGGTAPIENGNYPLYVDPVPQALVLTAIVIGVSVTALALAVAMGYYRKTGTIELDKEGVMKW
ncbi:MAG: cation:proton antiporter subunit C [Euryarchaeota archaeon]|nr:cation:proton antiporter subunit C [Euryarchaeota archaeon]